MGLEVLAIAAITTLVSTGVSIYGQQQAAKSQEYAAKYNNKLAENEARNRELESAESQKRMRQQNRREMATLRNNLSGNGTLTTTGTSLNMLGESAGFMDLAIRDAARTSQMEAASIRARGRMGLWEAEQAKRAANISSAGEAFKGISSVVKMY